MKDQNVQVSGTDIWKVSDNSKLSLLYNGEKMPKSSESPGPEQFITEFFPKTKLWGYACSEEEIMSDKVEQRDHKSQLVKITEYFLTAEISKEDVC